MGRSFNTGPATEKQGKVTHKYKGNLQNYIHLMLVININHVKISRERCKRNPLLAVPHGVVGLKPKPFNSEKTNQQRKLP
jgi:hypothetical protein